LGSTWASVEVPDLSVHPVNLILYIHLRILEYSSNIFMASFVRIDSKLASGTLKNFILFRKSLSFSDRVPAMKLICLTIQPLPHVFKL
jgi:hypothetical protein